MTKKEDLERLVKEIESKEKHVNLLGGFIILFMMIVAQPEDLKLVALYISSAALFSHFPHSILVLPRLLVAQAFKAAVLRSTGKIAKESRIGANLKAITG